MSVIDNWAKDLPSLFIQEHEKTEVMRENLKTKVSEIKETDPAKKVKLPDVVKKPKVKAEESNTPVLPKDNVTLSNKGSESVEVSDLKGEAPTVFAKPIAKPLAAPVEDNEEPEVSKEAKFASQKADAIKEQLRKRMDPTKDININNYIPPGDPRRDSTGVIVNKQKLPSMTDASAPYVKAPSADPIEEAETHSIFVESNKYGPPKGQVTPKKGQSLKSSQSV